MTIAVWTPEVIDLLNELFFAGQSRAEIARQLHVSKNAVAGKIHRLGLERIEPPRPPTRRARLPEPEPIWAVVEINIETGPIPFIGRGWDRCASLLDARGPKNVALCCGRRVRKGSSWCPDHHAVYIAIEQGLTNGQASTPEQQLRR